MAHVKFTTNHGDFTLDIDEVNAPLTAANFLQYVRDGHYNNTVFHRVIDTFMIQGGGFEPGMKQKSGRAAIEHEGPATSAAGLKNVKYAVAMARTGDPHSGSSQFFINTVDNAFLDFQAPSGSSWGYTVFGKVADGFDTVEKIKAVRTGSSGGHQNVPTDDVVVSNAVIV
jgi:peptidyl-prolyl cis-trans isomerase B (cyclophilin B)